MTTILTAYKKGIRVGRCDRTCYDSKGTTCTCICEGRNHGKGENHAVRNAPALARILGKNPQAIHHQFELHCTTMQLALFPQDTDPREDPEHEAPAHDDPTAEPA